jgi:hypothetical protein
LHAYPIDESYTDLEVKVCGDSDDIVRSYKIYFSPPRHDGDNSKRPRDNLSIYLDTERIILQRYQNAEMLTLSFERGTKILNYVEQTLRENTIPKGEYENLLSALFRTGNKL